MRPCALDDGYLVGNEGGLALPSWSEWSAARAGVIKHMNTQRALGQLCCLHCFFIFEGIQSGAGRY